MSLLSATIVLFPLYICHFSKRIYNAWHVSFTYDLAGWADSRCQVMPAYAFFSSDDQQLYPATKQEFIYRIGILFHFVPQNSRLPSIL